MFEPLTIISEHLPRVTFMRMDGDTPPDSRHDIMVKFNNDATVDVLLLTMSVSGLDHTLTGLVVMKQRK